MVKDEPNKNLKGDYKIKPEIYNHMSKEEQTLYKILISTYNLNTGKKVSGGLLLYFGIPALILGIAVGGEASFLVFVGIILIGISIFLFTSKEKNNKTLEKIKELESIVQYRIKEKEPKTKLEDWKEKKEANIKKEVIVKKDIKIEKKIAGDDKFCSECGKKIKKNAKFCSECGAKQ